MKKHILSALLAGVFAATALPAAAAENLAVINGQPIPQARYDFFIEQLEKEGRPITPEVQTQVQQELVRRAVFEQEAAKQKLDQTELFKEEIALTRQTLLVRALFQDYLAQNPITEADIEAEYNKLNEANKGTEYRSAHVLVDTEDEAKAIIAELKKDADKFADIATEQSKDPGSASAGGDLGWARPEIYVPEFGEALGKLKKGEFTQEPVQTQFGWHVLRLDDTRDAEPPALETVRGQIEQSLTEQRLLAYEEQLFKAAKIEMAESQ